MTTPVQVAKVLRSVSELVRAGRGARAVHLLVQAYSHDGAIRQVDLVSLLTRQLGRQQAEALLKAFAAHPCMVCKRGLLVCEACRGEGVSRDGRVCDSCAGLGAANCDFCAGSGWITYNCIPGSLRAAVVVARCKLALAEAHALLAAPLPDHRKQRPSVSRKDLEQRLLRFNRLQGAFNNALDVARHSPDAGPAAKAVLKKIEAACTKAATKLERTIRRLLLLLGEVARAETARATEARKRELGDRRAKYYAALARSSNFTGTCLYHLYLDDLRRRSKNPRASRVKPSKESSG